MWSQENRYRERGLLFEGKPSVLREYSCSPPRTPRVPEHLRGFIVHGTPGEYESQNSYFFLPFASAAAEIAPSDPGSTSQDKHATLSAGNNTENPTTSAKILDPDALELWTAFEAKDQSDNESVNSNLAVPALSFEDAEKPDAEQLSDSISQYAAPEASYRSFDEPFISDSLLARFTSPPPTINRSALSSPIDLVDPIESMYHNAKNTSSKFLSKLLNSPKVDVVNESTGKVYVRGVSLHMLEYFCGIDTMTSLLFASYRSNQISVPSSYASKNGIIRVIRYMRRWDTPFGDAIVWYVLEEVMGGKHALADEVRWMLEQEEYEDLKVRVRKEMKKKEWRNLGRKGFLRRCQRARELGAVLERVEDDNSVQNITSPEVRGSYDNDKPLPNLPASS